jgi:Ring finger domain
MKMELHPASGHGSQLLIFLLTLSSFSQYALAQHPATDVNSNNDTPIAFIGFIVLGVVAFLLFACVIPLCIIRNGLGSTQSTTTTTTAFGSATTINDGGAGPKVHGVDQNVIEMFPLINYAAVKHMRASKSPLECAICLSEFLDDDTLRLLPGCRHVFHVDCISAWLIEHKTCPVCRSNLSDPKVIAGKRLLSLNIESKDVAGCSHMSEQADIQKLKEPRHVQSMTAWERFTLILPEDVMKDIKTSYKYRKAVSLQDYTKKGSAGRRDWRIQSFMNTLSWNRQQKMETKVTAVPDMSDTSDSANISSRQLLAFSATGEKEMLEINSSWNQIELDNLPVVERV